MDLSNVKNITIPEGDVVEIASDESVLWKKE